MAEYTNTVTTDGGIVVTAVLDTDTNNITYTVTLPNGMTASNTYPAGQNANQSNNSGVIIKQFQAQGFEGPFKGMLVALRQAQDTVKAEDRATKQAEVQPPPPTTASQAASDDAPKGPNAPATAEVKADGRIVAPPDTTAPTNADSTPTTETDGDRGLDDNTRTTEQTQATDQYSQGINVRAEDGTLSNLRKNPETGELYDPGGMPGGVDLKTNPGTSTNDDAANNSRTTTTTDVNKAQANPIQVTPQPNILDRYNNYAWSASVYLMSSAQYSKLMNSKDKKIDGYNLLF